MNYRFEYYCLSEGTKAAVDAALKEGHILTLVDPEEELVLYVLDIIEQKLQTTTHQIFSASSLQGVPSFNIWWQGRRV